MMNTPETVTQRLSRGHPYWSASYGDVCNAVDREMEARKSLACLQQEREGLIALLQRCAGWVFMRIEGNADEHGECSGCWEQSGTNKECAANWWVINARAFHDEIAKALKAVLPTPPTETQEPRR